MTTSKLRRSAIYLAAAVLIPTGVFAASTPALADPPPACASNVPSDFNGDGFADIAAGAPYRTVAGVDSAGAVRVVYGGPTGLATSGTDQYFDQNSSNVVGAPTENDNFGWDLATGNFNGDCYADLAIATPGENDVTILYGSAAGLTTTDPGHIAGNQSKSSFGWIVTAGDFNGDGIDDLAVGAPFASDAGKSESGEVGIAYGSASGLQQPAQWIDQSTASVPGVAETDDGFGNTLAAGDFNGDGVADLAIGVPNESNGSVAHGGSVTVVLGSKTQGLTGTGAQLWTQSTSGVPGTDEKGDNFGTDLAAGDVNGDGKADLVIGAQNEDVGTAVDAGDITYLAGSKSGLTATGSKSYSQATADIPGTAEKGDNFGFYVVIGDFNGDGKGDIAVGTPFEDGGSDADSGTVTIIKGTSSGPTATGAKSWDQNSAGIGGTVEEGDWFGFSLYAANITTGHTDLVVGVPGESTGTDEFDGALNVIPGSAGGLTSTGSQYFGEPTDVAGSDFADEWGFSVA
ncbi:MAG TPA: FG-GAP repeat protein [Micromonosporaceae bacterium]